RAALDARSAYSGRPAHAVHRPCAQARGWWQCHRGARQHDRRRPQRVNRPVPAEHDGPFWTGELDYRLPEQSIAQVPAERREDSRLMVLDRTREGALHSRFSDIARFIPDGALLVANDSKV